MVRLLQIPPLMPNFCIYIAKFRSYPLQTTYQPLHSGPRPTLTPKQEPSEEKMRRISERTTSYKRSTNNSHKKFICVAKRLLLKLLPEPSRKNFEDSFTEYKNSRTYFFIILAHAKLLLSPENS